MWLSNFWQYFFFKKKSFIHKCIIKSIWWVWFCWIFYVKVSDIIVTFFNIFTELSCKSAVCSLNLVLKLLDFLIHSWVQYLFKISFFVFLFCVIFSDHYFIVSLWCFLFINFFLLWIRILFLETDSVCVKSVEYSSCIW